MSDGAHLLIPFAASRAEGCIEARRSLALPHLEKLLARLAPAGADEGDEHTLSMPHERVLARIAGLPVEDGATPWAAWRALQEGGSPGVDAHAWFTPCHWRVGTGHIAMDDPAGLGLSVEESTELLHAMQRYFSEDGIDVQLRNAGCWLARGEVFRGLATASLDRVSGASVDTWLPRAPQARTLRRLQQEMQMLLYTHPVNEARAARGALPVNSFWVSGTGALPHGMTEAPAAGLRVDESLRSHALRGDWPAWRSAWMHLDTQPVKALLDALDTGHAITITFCGDRGARTWAGTGGGWWGRIKSGFGTHRVAPLLDGL